MDAKTQLIIQAGVDQPKVLSRDHADRQVRLECLRLASNADTGHSDVIETAQRMFEFVTGQKASAVNQG